MSETPKKLSLDAVLREWPTVDGDPHESQKPSMDWEQMARRIDERVASGDACVSVAYVSNENLLAEPLGQNEGDGLNSAATPARANSEQTRGTKGETMTMPVDRVRDRQSLQDLAKMAGAHGAMTPPPPSVNGPASVAAPHSSAPSGVHRGAVAEAKKDDSGIVDLAMASQADPGAAVRAQTTPLASEGLFDDEPASIRPPPMSAGPMSGAQGQAPVSQQFQQPAPSIPPFSVNPSAPLSMPFAGGSAVQSSAQQPVQFAPKKRSGVVIALVFGGLVAASAVAAGGYFFVQHRAAEKAVALAAADAKPVAPVVATPEAKPAETQAAATPAPEATIDPNALPEGKVAVAPKAVALKGGTAPAPIAKAAAPAKPEEATKLSAKDLPTTPAGPGGDLGDAMGKAVGPKAEVTPAAGTTGGPQFAAGTVPQKPSQGAVTGALGAVMSGARGCLGPDDPVSRASITFTSAGTVQNVNVSGGAAGKPAEGCIKAALGKAKLPPFAEPTYTANITVRH